MKKLVVFAFVCLALVFTGCKKEQHTYTASMEYHFANHDDEVSVKAVLNSLSAYWEGDFTWNGSTEWADVKAESRFSLESLMSIVANFDNKLQPYFHEGDYLLYTLTRKDDNTMLWQYKITKDGEEEVYHNYK